MSDKSNGRKLDETQVEQLLGAFYKTEMPGALDNLPSAWPEMKRRPAEKNAVPTTVSVSQIKTAGRESSSAGRAVAVIASLAACVMLVVLSNFGGGSSPAENTIQVSGDDSQTSGIVDPDVSTTMEEVDGFEFESDNTNQDSETKAKHEN